MIFYSFPFAVFFAALLLALQCTKTCRQQHIVFLLANIIFYGYWDVRFLTLLAAVILVCYGSALFYTRKGSRVFIAIPMLFCIGILAVCKYLNFFIESFCRVFHMAGPGTLNIILPLGISFYLFQAMSYVLDVGNEKISAEKSLLKLAAYISFFPQITSGPIVKAHDFLPQLERLHRVNRMNLSLGIQQFMLGLTKKVVFADRIGIAVNAVYSAPSAYNSVSIIGAILGYSLQIYFDFSGYSDMAIGIARILDFDLGKNFDLPYLAKNPSDFWRRWHISLSTWFRDYVYIPLGGNRKGEMITYRNLFLTMLLSGLWHGANWTFLLWGALHGIGSAVHRFFSRMVKLKETRISGICSALLNFILVSLLWIVFRASDLSQAWQIITGIFRRSGITYISVYAVVFFIMTIISLIMGAVKHKGHAGDIRLDLGTARGQFFLCLWILLVIVFMYVGDSAFIYAQF